MQHPNGQQLTPGHHRVLEELKKTQEAFDDRSRFLDAVLESLDTGIVACDAAGVLTFFNSATRKFHGLPESPLPSEKWAEHYSLYQSDGKTLMSRAEVPLYRALQGETVQNVEMVIAPRNGRRRTLLASGRMLLGADGRKAGAVVAMHDITELKEAKLAIQQSELFLDSIVENIPNMIFVKDAERLAFVRFNRAGKKSKSFFPVRT